MNAARSEKLSSVQKRHHSIRGELVERYRLSIEATEKIFGTLPEHKQKYVIKRLIEECEAARKYDWRNSGDLRRKRDLEMLQECKKTASSSRKIANTLKRHRNEFAFALAAASLESKTALVETGAESDRGEIERLSDLLEAFERHVRAKEALAKVPSRRPPADHKGHGQKVRTHSALVLDLAIMRGRQKQFGPLHFPEGLHKPIKPDVVLAIYLMALVRSYEASDIWGIQAGERIPQKPNARWSLVTVWVAQALGPHNSTNLQKNAEASIRRNPKLEILDYR